MTDKTLKSHVKSVRRFRVKLERRIGTCQWQLKIVSMSVRAKANWMERLKIKILSCVWCPCCVVFFCCFYAFVSQKLKIDLNLKFGWRLVPSKSLDLFGHCRLPEVHAPKALRSQVLVAKSVHSELFHFCFVFNLVAGPWSSLVKCLGWAPRKGQDPEPLSWGRDPIL